MSKTYPRLVRLGGATAVIALSASAAVAAEVTPSRAPAATTQTTVPSYRERYTVLSDRNIFVRERYKIVKEADQERRDQRRGSSNDAPRPPMEAGFVLTGVVLEEGLYRAYVEDSSASRILRLANGDPVANGHVVAIAIDAIAYEANGQTKSIAIGCDLTGTPISLSTTRIGGDGSRYGSSYGSGGSGSGSTTGPANGATAVAPPTPPLPDPNNPNLSLEERMRLRRAQELKK